VFLRNCRQNCHQCR